MLNEYLFMLMLISAWPAPAEVTNHQVISAVTSEQTQPLSQTDAMIRLKLLNDPLSPVVGAEQPELKIVSFVNYDCIHCKRLDTSLERLLKAYPQIAITYKLISWGPEASTAATRRALSVWIEQPEKFHAFHHALMSDSGMDNGSRIYSALHAAGISLSTYPLNTQNIIEVNKEMMRRLHFTGTPTTIIGDSVLTGEVTYEVLEEAVNTALAAAKDEKHLAVLTK
ncbi:thioredoxin domain-containing protein [Pantoea vagans]|uniref:thioredoxin domain-containing protein n=1 Tax=Pantoea vagans TaxID=470934 RepID=UPI00224ECAF5|nr:thioredoxin domain-containing protein [Pantoea vagans]MCX3308315.1 thioredoxin domain-containing protein [Pantoea vagans]